MNGLIDNWTIERIIDGFDGSLNNASPELQIMISALVLWDEVCYFDNGSAEWWNYVVRNEEQLQFLNMLSPIKGDEDGRIKDKAKEQYSEYKDKYTGLVAKGALEYLHLADEKNLCYIPFNERADFIRNNNLYRDFNRYYTRMDVIESVDEEVVKYYDEIRKIIKKVDLQTESNCIFNYVKSRAGNVKEVVDVIKELREKKMVKDFKSWMVRLETMIDTGKDVGYVMKEIKKYNDELKYVLNNPYITLPLPIDLEDIISIDVPIRVKRPIRAKMVFPVFLFNEGKKQVIQ